MENATPSTVPSSPTGNRAFALVAATAMTAVSVTLAAAMLSSRTQWQVYASKSAEKAVLETAATAEAQDFMHRVHDKIKKLDGSDVEDAGKLPASELFASNPFRRVELRGGIGRTTSGAAPKLYKEIKEEGVVGTVSDQVNASSPGAEGKVIKIPALWVPADPALAATAPEKNPSKVALGKDDPFYDVSCRSSYAAISAYSAPRKAFFTSAGARDGFGNVVVSRTRTFPVSAFTAMQFDDETPISYTNLPARIHGSSVQFDELNVGRVYTMGKVNFAAPANALRVVALKGIESNFSQPPPTYRGDDDDDKGKEDKGGEDHGSGDDSSSSNTDPFALAQAENTRKLAEINGKENKEISEIWKEKTEEVEKCRAAGKFEEADKKAKEYKDKEAEVRRNASEDRAGEDVRYRSVLADLNNAIKASSSKAQFSSAVEKAAQMVSSSPNSNSIGSGERKSHRGVSLGRYGKVKPEENSAAVVASLDNFGEVWNKERLDAFRGTLVTAANGGTELVRNSRIVNIGELIGEMSSHADCTVRFGMSPPDPVTGLTHPVIDSGGVKLRVDTKKPLDPSVAWYGEGEESGAPFYWVKNGDTVQGGLLVFDPSRLRFVAPTSGASNSRPFSIAIDCEVPLTSSATTPWYFFVKNSGAAEGVTIVTAQPMYVRGNFLTQGGGLPSLLVSPQIYACADAIDKTIRETTIEATVITEAYSPTELFSATQWQRFSPPAPQSLYPSSPPYVLLKGSSIAWGRKTAPSVTTYPLAVSEDIMAGDSAPALVPVVGEIRISATLAGTKQVSFSQ